MRFRGYLSPLLLAAVILATAAPPASAITGPGAHVFDATQRGQTATATITFSTSRGVTDPGEPVRNVRIEGPDAAVFAIVDDRCTGRAITSACTVTVRFTPVADGRVSADLVVAGDDALARTRLEGTAFVEGPRLEPSPARVDFGAESVDQLSEARRITFTNRGDHPAEITAATVAAPEFAIVEETCAGRRLAAGAVCSVTVRFAPPETGGGGVGTLLLEGESGTLASVELLGAARVFTDVIAVLGYVIEARCARARVVTRPRRGSLSLTIKPLSCRVTAHVSVRRAGTRRSARREIGPKQTAALSFGGLPAGRYRIKIDLFVNGDRQGTRTLRPRVAPPRRRSR